MRLLPLLALALFAAPRAHAYPNFIGYGYTSCLVCHFNPLGNGPLTDYGRALGATAISAKPFYDSKATDESIGESSGFLGSTKLPDWVRPSVDFRGLLLVSDLEKKERKTRFIPMQADVGLVLKHPENKYYASATVGYYPSRDTVAAASEEDKPLPLISREHYVAFEATPNLRVYGGMMDIAYGIRIADHIAFSRANAGLAMNDQVHGVLVHFSGEKFEAALHPFIGNLFQDSTTRLKGAAATFEYDLAEKFRGGASVLYGTNDFRTRMMGSLHTRVGMGEGSAFLAELGFIKQTTAVPSDSLSSFILTQGLVRVARGFHVLITGEFYTEKLFMPTTRTLRFGPSVQYFPLQRLELRLDLLSTRNFGNPLLFDDPLSMLGQVHLWF